MGQSISLNWKNSFRGDKGAATVNVNITNLTAEFELEGTMYEVDFGDVELSRSVRVSSSRTLIVSKTLQKHFSAKSPSGGFHSSVNLSATKSSLKHTVHQGLPGRVIEAWVEVSATVSVPNPTVELEVSLHVQISNGPPWIPKLDPSMALRGA